MQKIKHLNDLIRIQKIFRVIDFDLSYDECAELWHHYAMNEFGIEWTLLPESDSDVLKAILSYYDFGSDLFNETFKETAHITASYSICPAQIKKEYV